MIALRIMRDSGFEFTDKADSILHPSLCIRAKRPVPETEPAPYEIDERSHQEKKLRAKLRSECQPLHVLHHGVQFVSVNNQNAFPAGSHVNSALSDVDVPISTKEAGYQLVVISRNVNYAGALAGFAQDFLDDVVMLLGPINS